MSQIRQNYHNDVETQLNKQINMELYNSYVYLSLWSYFDRDDVALAHIAKWFKEQSEEEREHATKLMEYQNKRGGRVILQPVQNPDKNEWGSPLEAFKSALALEKHTHEALMKLHKVAADHNDMHTTDFLEEKYLHEQVDAINKIGKFITNLERVGTGLGEFMFDHEQFD